MRLILEVWRYLYSQHCACWTSTACVIFSSQINDIFCGNENHFVLTELKVSSINDYCDDTITVAGMALVCLQNGYWISHVHKYELLLVQIDAITRGGNISSMNYVYCIGFYFETRPCLPTKSIKNPENNFAKQKANRLQYDSLCGHKVIFRYKPHFPAM